MTDNPCAACAGRGSIYGLNAGLQSWCKCERYGGTGEDPPDRMVPSPFVLGVLAAESPILERCRAADPPVEK
jgi:hypothetical protein